MIKKNLPNICLFITSSIFCLFLTEITLRYALKFNEGNQIKYYRKDEVIKNLRLGKENLQTKQKSNTGDFNVKVKFNNLGLRDERNLIKANKDSIIVVGDSFTFGFGVQEKERFTNLLIDKYNLDIYNVAIPNNLFGYKALIQYSKLVGAESENIILVICMENDLLKRVNTIKESKKSNKKILKNIKSYLTKNSAIYFAMTSALHKNQSLKIFFTRAGLIKPLLENNIDIDNDIKKTALLIDEITKSYNRYVVLIPSRYNWYGTSEMIKKIRKEHSNLNKTLEALGIKVIDLRTEFELASNYPLQDFHFKYDGHWNKMGHLKAAEIIGEFLKIN